MRPLTWLWSQARDLFFAALVLMAWAVFGDIFDERDDPRGE